MKWIGAMLVIGLMVAPAMATVTINEIRIDQSGGDYDEYFELVGDPEESLDGLTYLVIGDGIGTSGVIEAVVNLTGYVISSNGFFFAAEDADTFGFEADLWAAGLLNFENGDNVTHMLVSGFTGYNGQDLDLDDDGTLDETPWTAILDDVALIERHPPEETGDEWVYSANQVGPNGYYVPSHVYRNPDATGNWEIGSHDPLGGQDSPGRSNIFGLPPMVYGKLTTTTVNTLSSTITLCKVGGQGVVDFVIVELSTNGTGTLRDGGVDILAVPHTVAGNLTYMPDTGYSGLDSFKFMAVDEQLQESPVVKQEVAVQSNAVVISEVMYDPSSYQSTYEFIEIYNYSGSTVQLTRLDTDRDDEDVDTTDNLVGAQILAGEMLIIAIDNTALYPDSAEEFRCEWKSLFEADIIRIPLVQWEYMWLAVRGDTQCDNLGSRILLFGEGGVLLDAVDLQMFIANDSGCSDTSYAIRESMLLPPGTLLDTANNDSPISWACSGDIDDGKRTGETGDTGSPGYVPSRHESPTYDDPCYGACCLTTGNCVDDMMASQCLDARCGLEGGFHQSQTCASVSATCAAEAEVPKKCCLPTGTCVDLGPCECWLNNGSGSDTTCAVNPDCLESYLVINELDYDQISTDTEEFVELYGDVGQSLDGWSLEFFNGGGPANDNFYKGVDLSGYILADGYLVIGSSDVENVDVDFCSTPGAGCSNQIQNGSVDGDGLALIFTYTVINEPVSEFVAGLSYETPSEGGMWAMGGSLGTNGPPVMLPDMIVDDTNDADLGLQRIPDGGTWTECENITPGEANACLELGACCYGYDCVMETEADCIAGGGDYKGDDVDCADDPCAPQGACCMPNGSCDEDMSSNACEQAGGTWQGEDSICMDIAAFIECLTGPALPITSNGCLKWDLFVDGHVDLLDYAVFQGEICIPEPEPVGACCIPPFEVDSCIETTPSNCVAQSGNYQGDGLLCAEVDCSSTTIEIYLNEVLGSTTSTDSEFIELYNGGASAVAIGDWKIELWESDAGQIPGSDAGSPYIINTSATIPAGGYYLLANPTFATYYTATPDQSIQANAIENSSYTIILKDDTGATIDSAFVTDGDEGDYANDNGNAITPSLSMGPDGANLPAGFYRVGDGGVSANYLEWSPQPAPSATPGAANPS
ncbi:MAG: lamin tail domain-containing protein [Phycisphaerae bacterium]|nr:lamin tail domain-containing protein [Phycisphaerae bacterium]